MLFLLWELFYHFNFFRDGSNWISWHVDMHWKAKFLNLTVLLFCSQCVKENSKFLYFNLLIYARTFSFSYIVLGDGSNWRYRHVDMHKEKKCTMLQYFFSVRYSSKMTKLKVLACDFSLKIKLHVITIFLLLLEVEK